GYMPHERDARSKGIPSMGAGAIYPLEWDRISVAPFEIPRHWPRCYSLDPGWKATAVTWHAWDPTDGVQYVYAEYKKGHLEPHHHARVIKARGKWMCGVVDPAAEGTSPNDGKKIINLYRKEGLLLSHADNAVESGIYEVWAGLEEGSLRYFEHLTLCKSEHEKYRRIEAGSEKRGTKSVIVKKDDHLMDTVRYARVSGRAVAKVEPAREMVMPASSAVGDGLTGY
ncbi:MAG: hypothetical protein AAGD08_15930, partial [Pseudomonadota bacterium]